MNGILKELTLLYAEDEIEVQEEMKEYFEHYFKEVLIVSDGENALKLYKKHKPQVVILDIYIPKIDGLELTQYIRETDSKTKIVIISAHSKSELMLKAINTNVDYYIIKPATVGKIKEMISKISQELLIESKEIIILGEEYKYLKRDNKLFYKNEELELSVKESRLLEMLIKNKGYEVNSEDLILFAWGDEALFNIGLNSLKTQISNLRKKLPPNSIKTVYGGGYIFKN